MSDLLALCAGLAAGASHVATGVQAMEIELSDGGHVVFLTDPEGGFCAGGITDDAGPEMIKTLTAAMENLGLPLYSFPAEKAADGVAEVTRLYAKGKQA